MRTSKEKKYTSWQEIHNEKYINDPEYRAGYDSLEPEFAVYEALIRMRKEKKITQKELAKKMNTYQSSIARFEAGTYNPSFVFVQKIARALGLKVVITG